MDTGFLTILIFLLFTNMYVCLAYCFDSVCAALPPSYLSIAIQVGPWHLLPLACRLVLPHTMLPDGHHRLSGHLLRDSFPSPQHAVYR